MRRLFYTVPALLFITVWVVVTVFLHLVGDPLICSLILAAALAAAFALLVGLRNRIHRKGTIRAVATDREGTPEAQTEERKDEAAVPRPTSAARPVAAPSDAAPSHAATHTEDPFPGVRPLSLDDVHLALHAHRMRMLEPYHLTEREQEVTELLLEGQTLKNIAEQLFITERTVKFHSKNVYDKLGVRSKKELLQMFSDMQ